MDLLITGKSMYERELFEEKAQKFLDCLDEIKEGGKDMINLKSLKNILKSKIGEDISRDELQTFLKHFENEEVISVNIERGGVVMIEI